MHCEDAAAQEPATRIRRQTAIHDTDCGEPAKQLLPSFRRDAAERDENCAQHEHADGNTVVVAEQRVSVVVFRSRVEDELRPSLLGRFECQRGGDDAERETQSFLAVDERHDRQADHDLLRELHPVRPRRAEVRRRNR